MATKMTSPALKPDSEPSSEASSPDFTTYFEEVTDPRIERRKEERRKEHTLLDITLLDIIGLTICAVVAGADTFAGIERFGEAREEWLGQFLELKNGIPSHDTIGEVWGRVDPEEFETGFRRWIGGLTDSVGEVVAVDGKTLRRSYDRPSNRAALNKAALQMIDVWSCKQELVLGQRAAVPETTNETGALPELLRLLELEGAIVTIDAAGCYSDVVEGIVEAGADYAIALKENQKTLQRDTEALFEKLEGVGRLPESWSGACPNPARPSTEDTTGSRSGAAGRLTPRTLRSEALRSGLGSRRCARFGLSATIQMGRPKPKSGCLSPVWRQIRSDFYRRFVGTGMWRTSCTGRWTWPSPKTIVGFGAGMRPRTWGSFAAWRLAS